MLPLWTPVFEFFWHVQVSKSETKCHCCDVVILLCQFSPPTLQLERTSTCTHCQIISPMTYKQKNITLNNLSLTKCLHILCLVHSVQYMCNVLPHSNSLRESCAVWEFIGKMWDGNKLVVLKEGIQYIHQPGNIVENSHCSVYQRVSR